MDNVMPMFIWVKGLPPCLPPILDATQYKKSFGLYKDKPINKNFFCMMIITAEGVRYE